MLGGGCFVKKSRVELFIKLERSLYKQGQYIRPVVECTVEKGEAAMIVTHHVIKPPTYQALAMSTG